MDDLIYPLSYLSKSIAFSIQLWPVFMEFCRRSTCKEFLDKLNFDSQFILPLWSKKGDFIDYILTCQQLFQSIIVANLGTDMTVVDTRG